MSPEPRELPADGKAEPPTSRRGATGFWLKHGLSHLAPSACSALHCPPGLANMETGPHGRDEHSFLKLRAAAPVADGEECFQGPLLGHTVGTVPFAKTTR